MATAYNTTDSPVLIDHNGATLAGGEWGEVDTSRTPVKEALARGVLVITDDEESKASDTSGQQGRTRKSTSPKEQ